MSLKKTAGFGLVELLVSISIMVLISTVVLANHSSFTSNSLLRTQAYDVALRIREVQQAALSAQEQGGTGFSSTLGLHFSTAAPSASALAHRQRYRAFSSSAITGPGWQTSATSVGVPGQLDERFEVRSIIASSGGVTSSQGTLYISFVRPNFDARFYRTDGTLVGWDSVTISIGRPGSVAADQRQITVAKSGQITVE